MDPNLTAILQALQALNLGSDLQAVGAAYATLGAGASDVLTTIADGCADINTCTLLVKDGATCVNKLHTAQTKGLLAGAVTKAHASVAAGTNLAHPLCDAVDQALNAQPLPPPPQQPSGSACKPGMVFNASTGKCDCPAGSVWNGSECVAAGGAPPPPSSTSSSSGSSWIPWALGALGVIGLVFAGVSMGGGTAAAAANPATSPRPMSGYAYLCSSCRGNFRGAPDDDWDTVLIGDSEIRSARFVGKRTIDGSPCNVWQTSAGYIAQTVAATGNPVTGRELGERRDHQMLSMVDHAAREGRGVHVATAEDKRTVRRLVKRGVVRVERPGTTTAGLEDWYVYRASALRNPLSTGTGIAIAGAALALPLAVVAISSSNKPAPPAPPPPSTPGGGPPTTPPPSTPPNMPPAPPTTPPGDVVKGATIWSCVVVWQWTWTNNVGAWSVKSNTGAQVSAVPTAKLADAIKDLAAPPYYCSQGFEWRASAQSWELVKQSCNY